jgi:hypothetical protein
MKKPLERDPAMSEQTISCPKCGEKIKLTDAITQPIEEALRREFERALKSKEKEFNERLSDERTQLEKKVRKQAEESVTVELRDLKAQLDERSHQLDAARKEELDLRRRQRELQEREKNQELELARKLDEERQKIWQEASAKNVEEHQLKLREKDLQMGQMRRQIDELQRKADQGPQNRQGEVLELELEDLLRSKFPLDQIEPVAKGKRGGDVIQRVHSNDGQFAGIILWEAKRTKNWSDGWIQKLRDDQRDAKGDIAVIVSDVLPTDAGCISQVEGIWITDFRSALGLAFALREALLQVAHARTALAGKSEKMEVLYSYLCGPQFRQRIEAIVESFATMKTDLDGERRAMEKLWGKRERQIERVLKHTAGLHGDLSGIVGASLPAVTMLELSPGDINSQEPSNDVR